MIKDKNIAEMNYQKDDVIKMDYPDGKKHDVLFKTLCPIKIGDLYCYVGTCYDFTYNHDLIVLINYYNDCWYQIPVHDNCDYLSYYFNNTKSRHLDATEYDMGSRIRLAQSMNLVPPKDYLKKMYNYNKNNGPKKSLAELRWDDYVSDIPTFSIECYIPVNPNGEVNVAKNTFAYKNKYGNNECCFDKMFDNPKLIVDLTRGLKKAHENEHGVKEYDFDVEIPDDVKAVKELTKSDGSNITIGATVIPGKYNCRAYYSDFVDENDYNFAANNDNLIVGVDSSQYHKYFDADRIWKAVGNKELEIINQEGKSLRNR